MTEHHRQLIRFSMEHLAFLEEQIADWDREIAAHLQAHTPLKAATELAQSVPGIQQTAAAALVAEIGPDLGNFPSAGKLASWIGICPGNNESAGKRKSGQIRKGNPMARSTLVECAWSASRKKDSETQRHYERLKPRLQHKRSLVATAHLITIRLFQVLSSKKPYQVDTQPERTAAQTNRLVRHHTHRLKHLQHWLTEHNKRWAQPSNGR